MKLLMEQAPLKETILVTSPTLSSSSSSSKKASPGAVPSSVRVEYDTLLVVPVRPTTTVMGPRTPAAEDDDTYSMGSRSLGTGHFAVDGRVDQFVPTSLLRTPPHSPDRESTTRSSPEAAVIVSPSPAPSRRPSASGPRRLSSFIRVSDLDLDQYANIIGAENGSGPDTVSDLTLEEEEPHYHTPSAEPPPGIESTAQDRWIAVEDGSGTPTPIAPATVRALARLGQRLVMEDPAFWSIDPKCAKTLQKDPHGWHRYTWSDSTGWSGRLPARGSPEELEVLLWWGTHAPHSTYGWEVPVIRTAGIVNMKPLDMARLIMDSSRTKEYNRMSEGRENLIMLQEDLSADGPFGGHTKVVRGHLRVPIPMIRKSLRFTFLQHARALEDGSGYIIVGRTIHTPGEDLSQVLTSECLLGVHVMKRIPGDENRCLSINLTHLRSPLIPLVLARRIAGGAAGNFLNDIRAVAARTTSSS